MAHTYCAVSECESETRQGRTYCDFHEKRHQRGQSLTAPKVERLSPSERVIEAAHRYADVDAEDDVAFEQAKRALLRAAKALGSGAHGELVRQGHAAARRRGAHIGRPSLVSPEQARRLVESLGSTTLAATSLEVSPRTIQRALRRATELGLSSRQPRAA